MFSTLRYQNAFVFINCLYPYFRAISTNKP